jgi:hypothetical protein
VCLHRDHYSLDWKAYLYDSSLLDELDGNIKIHEIKGNYQKKYFQQLNCLDYWINPYRGGKEIFTWKKPLFKKVEKLMNEYDISAILATAPPFTMLKLGQELSKKYQIPLIIDLRDAWSMWCFYPYSSYVQFFLTQRQELEALKSATKIVATSEQTICDLQAQYPQINKDKFNLVTNGFDQKSFSSVDIIKYTPKTRVKICYVGSFYYYPHIHKSIFTPWWKKIIHERSFVRALQYVPQYEDWNYRSPYFIFKTLQYIKKTNPILAGTIEVVFAGKKPSWFDEMVKSFDINEIVSHIGALSHAESEELQKSADFLLITSAKVIEGRDYSIAGKTFEYFTTNKPILAFVNEGAQKDLLAKSGHAIILNPDNIEKSASTFSQILSQGLSLTPNSGFIKTLSREMLTLKLSNIIKSAISDDTK